MESPQGLELMWILILIDPRFLHILCPDLVHLASPVVIPPKARLSFLSRKSLPTCTRIILSRTPPKAAMVKTHKVDIQKEKRDSFQTHQASLVLGKRWGHSTVAVLLLFVHSSTLYTSKSILL